MRYDPLHLFGPSFTDEYIDGFYKGMSYLAVNGVPLPSVLVNGGNGERTTKAGWIIRLKQNVDYPIERLTI